MKAIKLIMIILLASASSIVKADFNPTNPIEPGVPPVKLNVSAIPTTGGTVKGSGKYVPGSNVTVTASAQSNFVFEKWVDECGNEVSTSRSYSFIKGEKEEYLFAHFIFSPGIPSEPSDPVLVQYFQLNVVAQGNGGTVSGGGKYQPNNSVRLSASVRTNFSFGAWINESGDTVSTLASFYYKTQPKKETLTAYFDYVPPSPTEPKDPILSHNVVVSTTEGGTVTISKNRLLEGESTTIKAIANTGYKFLKWYKNGEEYSSLSSFSYTMESSDVEFYAEFVYNPNSPVEPSMPSDKKYAFYLMSVNSKPGGVVKVPLILSSLDDLYDMTFQLKFPSELQPDMSRIEMSDKAVGYTTSYTATSDSTYQFSMIGGKVQAGQNIVLQLTINVPENIITGQNYDVKINQVSVTEYDGTHLTASTRNGSVVIYKRGDTNGDGAVDVIDKMNLIAYVLQQETEIFIKEVSDINEDGAFDVIDGKGVIEIILTE